MSNFVLDASVTLCWLFEDQATSYTDSILERLAGEDEARAAAIWPFEVANALVTAERRRLITQSDSAAFVEQLGALPVRVERTESEHLLEAVLALARSYRLSVYDASYLDLAMREALPLATMDSALRSAARAAGVRLT